MPGVQRPFQHLPLILRESGPARTPGGGQEDDKSKLNRTTGRAAHSTHLRTQATNAATDWRTTLQKRQQEALPDLPSSIPLLLEVDPAIELDDLRRFFNFEIVSEYENGFVIVAAADTDLALLHQKINDFAGAIIGSANVAKIHELHDDPDRKLRIEQVLSDHLLQEWPALVDDQDYTVDAGVVCLGDFEIDTPPKRKSRETDPDWAHRQAEWSAKRDAVYDRWSQLQWRRVDEVEAILRAYGGTILSITDDSHSNLAVLPDSFSVRIKVKGKGLKDFVLNYPFLFEVVEPDDIRQPDRRQIQLGTNEALPDLQPPPPDAPAVCVIDSGIQEQHRFLAPSIDTEASRCFLPGHSPTDVADYVRDGGHGTRVAGAVLYGEAIPRSGQYILSCWLQNARVLDDRCSLPERLFPPELIRLVVETYHHGPRRTRIFNHSINANSPCRLRHMSAWAAEIDLLSNRYDILVIQAAGNLPWSGTAPFIGIAEHIAAGRDYPAYLGEAGCRVANPGQSLQALTVGSIAYGAYESEGWRSFAREAGHPSAFSRSGFGIWGVIKPEVVEYGGDNLRSGGTPLTIGTPAIARDCYPELVRSTYPGAGPAFDKDDVGTSFSAPKVTRIAARLQEVLPDESCLLYRSLIVQSARWPEWAQRATPEEKATIIRSLGYGLPDIERASINTDYRVTMVTSGEKSIKAGEAHVYQVPIPPSMNAPGMEYDILVEVTLSYAAEPRRTRRNLRRYLATWVDWKSSRLNEPPEAFSRRALKDKDKGADEGSSFGWTLELNPVHGEIEGVKRSAGTVQKDWATVKSNQLPESFCIAVVGHKGWSRDPDSSAKYAMSVSFEILGKEIPIYEPVRVEIERLQAELEVEESVSVEF